MSHVLSPSEGWAAFPGVCGAEHLTPACGENPAAPGQGGTRGAQEGTPQAGPDQCRDLPVRNKECVYAGQDPTQRRHSFISLFSRSPQIPEELPRPGEEAGLEVWKEGQQLLPTGHSLVQDTPAGLRSSPPALQAPGSHQGSLAGGCSCGV